MRGTKIDQASDEEQHQLTISVLEVVEGQKGLRIPFKRRLRLIGSKQGLQNMKLTLPMADNTYEEVLVEASSQILTNCYQSEPFLTWFPDFNMAVLYMPSCDRGWMLGRRIHSLPRRWLEI